MRYLTPLMLAAALVAGGCAATDETPPPGPAAAGARADLETILAAVQAAVPAVPRGPVTWYAPETLFEYIDGMAGTYTDAGFVLLAHVEYAPKEAAGNAYVEVDLYDQGTPLGALDVMADSRVGDTVYLDLGQEAHDGEDLVELRVGRYYVRIVPRFDTAALRPLVRALAEAVAKAAPAGPSDAELVAPLPADRMVPHSADYATRAFLGRPFLAGVREAAYEADGRRVRLFVMDASTEAAARTAVKAWTDSLAPPPAADAAGVVQSTDPYVGTILMTSTGRHVAGAIGDAAAARPLLDALRKHLD